MAKVTEQDLINRGFNFSQSSIFMDDYRLTFNHILLGNIIIIVYEDFGNIIIALDGDRFIHKPLTTENLDLFIRFAKGEKL